MKRLLLIALMAGGLAFVPAQRSDAQVSVGIGGVGVGFGYPAYRYGYYNSYPYGYSYYPYGYYLDTTDHIGTMAILGETDTTGTTATGFTATTVIIITMATNLA
jgi:hypothetical protein